MRKRFFYSVIVGIILSCAAVFAQNNVPETFPDGSDPTIVEGTDAIYITLPIIYVFPDLHFRNQGEVDQYNKLVRDVKRTLPYAKMVYSTLIETYEYMQTLPNEKAKQQHLKRMEKDLFKEYKPELKRLSFSQGKLLIKLVDRECNQSSYNLLKAYLGSFRAGFWNFFASVFGASLKSEYDPKGKDKMTERVVFLVERGLL